DQPQLASSHLRATGCPRRVADGAALLPLWPEAGSTRVVQFAAEAGVHDRDRADDAVRHDRARVVQAGAALMARVADGRLSVGPHLALPVDVRAAGVHSRSSRDGGGPRLEQLCGDVDRLEARERVAFALASALPGCLRFGKL